MEFHLDGMAVMMPVDPAVVTEAFFYYSLSPLLFSILCSLPTISRVWTQGLVHARWALTHQATFPTFWVVVYAYVYVGVCAGVCSVCMRVPEANFNCHSSTVTHLVFWDRVLLRPGDSKPQESTYLCLPSTMIMHSLCACATKTG